MNTSIVEIISDLPTQAQTTALYSLVGSLNTRILYGAQRIVRDCERSDDDIHEEVNTYFMKTKNESMLRAESGVSHDTFKDLCAMSMLREELHGMLVMAVNNKEVMPISETLNFLTTPKRKLPQAELEALALALEIDADDIVEAFNMENEVARQRMLMMKENVLLVALSLPSNELGFEEISRKVQEGLLNKLREALNKARNNVVIGILQRRGTADLGDIPLIKAAISDVDWMLRNSVADIDIPNPSTQVAENVVDITPTHESTKPLRNKKVVAIHDEGEHKVYQVK